MSTELLKVFQVMFVYENERPWFEITEISYARNKEEAISDIKARFPEAKIQLVQQLYRFT